MKLASIIPGPLAITREAVTVIAGALLAAFIISQLTPVKNWIKAQWT